VLYFATASTERVREAMRAGYLGQIITPAAGNRLDEQYVEWVADNGIYSNAYPGDAAYIGWLESHADMRSRCRFAVAPDVVADHNATIERSWPMLRPIRRTVGRVGLCAQNGATPQDMPWDDIDAVFLAGIVECAPCGYVPALSELPATTCPYCSRALVEWKVGDVAAAITVEAKSRGKWVHMGRVNTEHRIGRARQMGCDSADGTFLAFGPDVNLPILLNWMYPDDFRFMRPTRQESRITTKPKATAVPDLFSSLIGDAA
jgi:hypothetical protein